MTEEKVVAELTRMVGVVPMFPSDPLSLANITSETQKFVDQELRLKWLVDTFINHVGRWEGIREFRAVYCTRFKPADGIEEFSRIQGYAPGDIEAEHTEQSERYKQLSGAGEEQLMKLIASASIRDPEAYYRQAMRKAGMD